MAIIEAADLPEGEKVYLKKDFLGWRVVEPIADSNGKIILSRLLFGSKRNFITLLLLMFILACFYIGVTELLNNQKEMCEIAIQNFTFPN